MTAVGSATKAMFKFILDKSYDRITEYFKNNPDVTLAYWASDELLDVNATEEEKEKFKARHPEILDLNDHTLVTQFEDVIVLSNFCERLRKGIEELWYDSWTEYCSSTTKMVIESDEDVKHNYKIFLSHISNSEAANDELEVL